jgi:hypothetical protein
VEHLKEARRQLSYYCTAEERFCREYVERVRETSLSVARARIDDLAGSQSYVGLDKEIIDLAEGVIRFYAEYISGILALHGEDVAVEVTAHVEVGGVILRRGETVILPPAVAARLAVAGLARPVESNAINLRVLQGAGGRGG